MVRKNKRPNIPESCPEGLSLLISRCWDQNPAKRSQFKVSCIFFLLEMLIRNGSHIYVMNFSLFVFHLKASGYDQEMLESLTADQLKAL